MGRSCRSRLHLSNVRIRILSRQAKLVDLSLNKSGNNEGPLRKRSDFNQAFVYIKPFTPRSWRITTQADARLEVPENGNRHRVLPTLGGNGVNLGGLPKNSKKVNTRGCMQRFTIERGNPLSTDLGVKPQTNGFHDFFLMFSFLLQIDRLQLTAVHCNRRKV